MENEDIHSRDSEQTTDLSEREIPFDATTNFSLLGWLWDKIEKAKTSKKRVDLNLEP